MMNLWIFKKNYAKNIKLSTVMYQMLYKKILKMEKLNQQINKNKLKKINKNLKKLLVEIE